ncbi:MAG: adenylosuccinate lyase [Phototrophicales bacterium]|nr:MAG: adenylosuccinate lyase [Phototrophicales bacterium]
MTAHDSFASPFSWRYGSEAMRAIWSEHYKRRIWRKIWCALASVQAEVGLVSREQAEDLAKHIDDIDVARSFEIEAEIQHDLMAEVKAFAEQCPVGGGIIHLGATSADIEDNADVIRIKDSLHIILSQLETLLLILSDKIEQFADVPTMGYTHIQPAEPTTVGYRLSFYAQDMLEDYALIKGHIYTTLRGKGLKGAVGTRASYAELLTDVSVSPEELEKRVMAKLDLAYYPVTGQTYPRKQDWLVLTGLAGLAASLHKLAFDLRLLQSPFSGEIVEPFASKQVGSSAMPFKRNPIRSEKINSLARYVASLPQVAWMNASQSLLERTLDDSANRREILPSAFLALDEMLMVMRNIIQNFTFDAIAARKNLDRFGMFSALERVMMAAVKAGADRQAMHELLRNESLAAWEVVNAGADNPLQEYLVKNAELRKYLRPEEITALLTIETYTGDAAPIAKTFADEIRHIIQNKD